LKRKRIVRKRKEESMISVGDETQQIIAGESNILIIVKERDHLVGDVI
jgi:hypothetical protein